MNVVITGASRGIGLELTSQSLQNGDRVFALVRNPEQAHELLDLQKNYPDHLHIGFLNVASPEIAKQARDALSTCSHIDILINNAGVYREGEEIEDFLESFRVNSIAPFLITQTLAEKLKKAPRPIAVHITSLMGSIEDNTSGGSYAYRASKCALNMINKSLAIDETWLVTGVIHPGWVQTRMGGDQAPTPVNESVRGIWRVIRGLKPEHSGGFFDYTGDRLEW